MRSIKKTFTVKKDPAGESGSAKSTPLPGLGTYHSDPAGLLYMTYQEQIKSPKWQKKRLETLNLWNYTCQICDAKDKMLNVHHIIYDSKRQLWDYDDSELLVLCEDCHKEWHSTMNDVMKQIAYCMTNLDNPLTFHKLEMIFEYYPFDTDIFDYIHKKAVEFEYPWNRKSTVSESDDLAF